MGSIVGSIAAAAVTGSLLASTALASSASLYQGPGPRPGPDVLYAPLADAPQLDNAPGGVWHAPPILTSGAGAYRDGEYLYQGYLYDDHGAKLTADPNDPMNSPGGDASGGDSFSAPNGTYTYPTDPRYAENAANLVELRVKPLADATAFRITLNTLHDPSLVATAIAIGGTPGVNRPFPFGANVSAPAQMFLTVHGATGVLTDAVTGLTVPGPAPTVQIDMLRRQITVLVPHSVWNPGASVVRLAGGVGLWDAAHERYLLPGASAGPATPGGGGALPNPAAFFDVAFRYNAQEPVPGTPGPTTLSDPSWWRDNAQGHALAAGDISQFFASVDFAKLAAGADDDMPGQPTGSRRPGPSIASWPRTTRPRRGPTTPPVAAEARPGASGSCAVSSSPTRSTCPPTGRCRPEAGRSRCCCTPWALTTTSSPAPATSRSSASGAPDRS